MKMLGEGKLESGGNGIGGVTGTRGREAAHRLLQNKEITKQMCLKVLWHRQRHLFFIVKYTIVEGMAKIPIY